MELKVARTALLRASIWNRLISRSDNFIKQRFPFCLREVRSKFCLPPQNSGIHAASQLDALAKARISQQRTTKELEAASMPRSGADFPPSLTLFQASKRILLQVAFG